MMVSGTDWAWHITAEIKRGDMVSSFLCTLENIHLTTSKERNNDAILLCSFERVDILIATGVEKLTSGAE